MLVEDRIHPAGGRPSSADATARREQILAAAQRLFLDHGYSATSLESIARAAGAAKKTVYRHFHDKDVLFAAVVHQLTDEWLESLRDLLDLARAPAEVLRAVAHRLADACTEADSVAVHRLVIAEAPRFPELAQAYHGNGIARGLRPLADYLATQSTRGTLHIKNPTLAAEQFAYLVSGALRGRALLGLNVSDDLAERTRMIDQALTLFLEGCAARRGQPV